MILHGARNPVSGWLVIEATQWFMIKRSVLFRNSLTLAFASTSHRGSTTISFLTHKEHVPVINLFSLSSKSLLLYSAFLFCSWHLWIHLLDRAMLGSAKRRHLKKGNSSFWYWGAHTLFLCYVYLCYQRHPVAHSLSCDFASTTGFLFTSSCFLGA